MDIQKLYEGLTIKEKRQLYSLLKKDIQNVSDFTIDKFCFEIDCNVRLSNVLRTGFDPSQKVSDITESDFLSIRNAGKKSWEEFTQLRKLKFIGFSSNGHIE